MAGSFLKGIELETAIRCEEVETKQHRNAGYRDPERHELGVQKWIRPPPGGRSRIGHTSVPLSIRGRRGVRNTL